MRKLVKRIGIAAAVIATVAVVLVLFDSPVSERGLSTAFASLGRWTYALAGGMAFLEVGTPVGLVAPTELAVPIAGAAAASGEVQLMPLIGFVWVCAAIGESVGFLTGRLFGREAIERHGARLRVTPERLARFDDHFVRYGTWMIVAARFGPYVRTLAPFLAGAARMRYQRFLVASIVGSGLWAAALCSLGYLLFEQASSISGAVMAMSAGIAAVVVAAFILAQAQRRRQSVGATASRRQWKPDSR